jgi:hypothetical protein
MSHFLRIILPSFVVGLIAVVFVHLRPFESGHSAFFEVRMTSERDGRARLFWDAGSGFSEHGQVGQIVRAGTDVYRFPLPQGVVRAFRLWPLDRSGKVTFHEVTVRRESGEVLHTFRASSLSPAGPADGASAASGELVLDARPGEGLDFTPAQPLQLSRTWALDPPKAAVTFVAVAIGTALLLIIGLAFPAKVRAAFAKPWIALARGMERVPVLILILTAAISVMLSCFPVIFCGKSFVSPGNGALLLYDDTPTVPSAANELPEDPRGSDMGALMWAHLPYSAIQHHAVFQDRELPLWNRYNYCGTPLLGQGLSMLGDPLHWIPITANGASWAWDVKFLCAKTLFALGISLCVRAATGGLWSAALLTLSSAFLGFFSYRFAHPAFFALCYSPWILLPWLRAATTAGRLWPWAILLALANFWQLNSGVVKESVALIGGLNFTGLLIVLSQPSGLGDRLRRCGTALWGLGLFVLLSAPCWMVFLDSLRSAWTPYATTKVFQIQPSLLVGLFDDLFYRQLMPWENHFNPAANFLVLLGCLWAVVNLRVLLQNPLFVGLSLGALPSALLAFGIIPPGLIAKIPFLGNVQHIDNTFSVVLIIHLIVLAGFGLRALWENAAAPRMGTDSAIALGLLALLLALFFGFTQAGHRDGISLWESGTTARFSQFFLIYSVALIVALLALPWITRSLRTAPSFGAVLMAGLAFFMIHFRQAMWISTPFDYYVMNPRSRTDLATESPAITRIKQRIAATSEPVRIAGYRNALAPGYHPLLGLEHFAGADALVNPFQRELAEATGGTPQWGWRWRLGSDGNQLRTMKLCDLWGVRYILAMPADTRSEPVEDDLDAIENPTAWPRAFFADRLIQCNALSSFLAVLDQSPAKPFAAVTSPNPIAVESGTDGVNTVPATQYQFTNNTTTFQFTAPGPGVAVLTEGYEDGNWQATVNGAPVEYFRVNHAFLGVKIPAAGTHTVRFSYWPRALRTALWLGAAGLFLVVLTPLLARLGGARNSAQ